MPEALHTGSECGRRLVLVSWEGLRRSARMTNHLCHRTRSQFLNGDYFLNNLVAIDNSGLAI